MNTVNLTVLEAPQHVLGPIAPDPEIRRVPGSIKALPDRIVVPALGDRITQEQEVDLIFFGSDFLGLIEKPLVHGHPGSLARRGGDGGRRLGADRQARAAEAYES